MKPLLKFGLGVAAVFLLLLAIYVARSLFASPRLLKLREFFNDPHAHADWTIAAGQRCGAAPFVFPTDGYVGFLWGDSFRPGHSHQGIDVFGGKQPGESPVVAAYDGYLTRLADWKSSVIIRVPSDPLHSGDQIWLYYTHMADIKGQSYIDARFPAGTSEVFVKAGTLLGYQGNYSGDPNNPTGTHLHFSIVRDDGQGSFLNELKRTNTYDPSVYFGLPLNGFQNKDLIPLCGE